MNLQKALVIFLILLVLFGIIIRFSIINKDFSAEEVDFTNPAEAIKETGHPIFYHSEQKPNASAILHPPMYIYSLAFIFNFFGENEIAARSINILFSFLTAILIYIFCFKLIGEEKGKIIGLISSTLFLINYYVLSSSILIDIDTFSMFFVFGFVFCILMYYKTQKNYFLLLSSLALFFGLANRYPMMILTYFFIGVYYYFNKELKRDFKKYVYVGVVSAVGALIVWGIYSIFIEPGNFFSFISHNTRLGAEQVSNLNVYIASFALNISQLIRLFTFPLVILMVWSWFYFLKQKSKLTKILLLYILPTFILFIIVPRPAFGYPRYFMTIFPGIFILTGIFLYLNLKNFKLGKSNLLIVLFSFIISLSLLLILNPQATIYSSNGLIKATNLPDFCFNIFACFPLLIVFFIKKEKRRGVFILILLALILSYSLYFDLKFVNHESYIKETGQYIKERTSEDEIIIAPKAVGYYTERRYYANDYYKPPLQEISISFFLEYFRKSLDNREMDNGFFWDGGMYGGTSFDIYSVSEEKLAQAPYVVLHYKLKDRDYEENFGEYYVYKIE